MQEGNVNGSFKRPLLLCSILFWILQSLFVWYGNIHLLTIVFLDFLLFLHFSFWFFIGNFTRKSEGFEKGFSSPLFILILFLVLFFSTSMTGAVVGSLWGDICIVCGSIPLLYEILSMLWTLRKTGVLDNSYIIGKGNYFLRRAAFRSRSIAVVLFLFLIFSPLTVTGINNLLDDKDKELTALVQGLTVNCINDTTKIKAILQWFNRTTNHTDKIANIYYREKEGKILLGFADVLCIFSEEPYFGVRTWDDSPLWVFNARCGRCGEYAILFTEMAHRANLTVRRVTCSGENHEWSEVYDSEQNKWLVIDPTAVQLPGSSGFMDVAFMERKVAGDLRTKTGNVSYVYARYPDGNVEDITARYTNLTTITLKVTDSQGKPLTNMAVDITSYNRGGPWDTRKNETTNETGYCHFTIGGGNYAFNIHNKNDIFSPTTTIYGSYAEVQSQYYVNATIHWTPTDYIFNNDIIRSIISILVMMMLFGILIFYVKKLKKIK